MDVTYYEKVEDMVPKLDVITINCPLHGGTEYLFNRKMLEKCKPGAFIVNTARGKIVDENALADAVDSGHIGGYAGDVWFRVSLFSEKSHVVSSSLLILNMNGIKLSTSKSGHISHLHFFLYS